VSGNDENDNRAPPPLRGRSVRAADREGGIATSHRPVAGLNRFRAKSMRSEMTDAERTLWMRLRAHRLNGLSFRRQTPIGPFIVDFVCHQLNLVIELDGGQHATDDETERDLKREQWLQSKGYRVLRFWNSDVLRQCDSVVQKILEVIAEALPPSRSATRTDLPLKGGGGDSSKQEREPDLPAGRRTQ
jgi:very-short-patch-repair endonuclease